MIIPLPNNCGISRQTYFIYEDPQGHSLKVTGHFDVTLMNYMSEECSGHIIQVVLYFLMQSVLIGSGPTIVVGQTLQPFLKTTEVEITGPSIARSNQNSYKTYSRTKNQKHHNNISISRDKYKTAAQTAAGKEGKGYHPCLLYIMGCSKNYFALYF